MHGEGGMYGRHGGLHGGGMCGKGGTYVAKGCAWKGHEW